MRIAIYTSYKLAKLKYFCVNYKYFSLLTVCVVPISIWHQGTQTVSLCKWRSMQDTGAFTTNGKLGSFTCPVYSPNTQEHFFWKEPVHVSSNFRWANEGSNSRPLYRKSTVLPMYQVQSQ